MIRLEKHKNIDTIQDENDRKKLINEIKASGTALNLVDQIIKERLEHLENSLDSSVGDPYQLAGIVKSMGELRKLTTLFKETNNDHIER